MCWSSPDGPPEPGAARTARRAAARRTVSAATRPRCSGRRPRRCLLAIVEERQKPPLLCRVLEGPQYDCRPDCRTPWRSCNFSLSARLPAGVAQERGLPAANARAGGVAATRSSRVPHSPPDGAERARRADPRRAGGSRRERGPRRPDAPDHAAERRASCCWAATACSSGSARAASASSGAPTTSCCTARWRSSASRSGPDGDGERAAREAHATARLAHPAIVALYEACSLGDAFYLISELVARPDARRADRADELDDEQVLEIGLALARRARPRPRARRHPPRHQAAERARPAPSATRGARARRRS